jgi:hypothetical protein
VHWQLQLYQADQSMLAATAVLGVDANALYGAEPTTVVHDPFNLDDVVVIA